MCERNMLTEKKRTVKNAEFRIDGYFQRVSRLSSNMDSVYFRDTLMSSPRHVCNQHVCPKNCIKSRGEIFS